MSIHGDTFSISALHLAIKVPYFSNSGHKNEKVTSHLAALDSDPMIRELRLCPAHRPSQLIIAAGTHRANFSLGYWCSSTPGIKQAMDLPYLATVVVLVVSAWRSLSSTVRQDRSRPPNRVNQHTHQLSESKTKTPGHSVANLLSFRRLCPGLDNCCEEQDIQYRTACCFIGVGQPTDYWCTRFAHKKLSDKLRVLSVAVKDRIDFTQTWRGMRQTHDILRVAVNHVSVLLVSKRHDNRGV
eukprot:SAG31_NODE_404_length_16109_cov_10.686696_9_plen_241_part_00